MAFTYIQISLGGAGGGTDDRRVKVSADDTTPNFLEQKIESASNKVIVAVEDPGLDEKINIDIDQTNIDHNQLLNYEADEHIPLDDTSTSVNNLWSASKIQDELDVKVNAISPIIDNTLVKSIGTSGVDFEATSIVVDDLSNVTGINDLTIDGNLTVNGTTTSINTDTLDVEDANITVNVGGTEASADAQDAGITVQMSDATDAAIGFDSVLASKFKIGEVGDLREILSTSHTQNVLNKTIDVDNNTVSNIEVDNLKSGVLVTDLNNAVDDTMLPSAQSVKDYVSQELATQDDASEITYTPNVSLDWVVTPSNVAEGLDELADRLSITEDDLSDHLGAGPAKHSADQIIYSGTLVATVVDEALDELDSNKFETSDFSTTFDSNLATKDTDDLTEGATNLYFEDQRAIDAVTNIFIDTDSIVLNYNNIDNEISADIRIDTLTSIPTIDIVNDDLIINDASDSNNVMKVKVSQLTDIYKSVGDIKETNHNLLQSQTNQDVVGFAFVNATVRSFSALVSVRVNATSSLSEEFTISGIQTTSGWSISIDSTGDDTDVTFEITSLGQITYSSTAYAGFTTGFIKFRAITTSV